MTKERIQLGAKGEDFATQHYENNGWKILDRNWRCREGELDIIATKNQKLAFCEVKTRSNLNFGSPAEAITPKKQNRIRKLALLWLAQKKSDIEYLPEIRFHVAEVMNNEVKIYNF